RKLYILANCSLAIRDGPGKIATLDAVLDTDVARVVLSIDKGCAVTLCDICEFRQRNLLSIGSADQEVTDLFGATAELRLHADHEIKEFFSLDDLCGGFSAYGRLDDGFDVGDIDTVTSDLRA